MPRCSGVFLGVFTQEGQRLCEYSLCGCAFGLFHNLSFIKAGCFFFPRLRIPLVFIGVHCLVLCLDNPFPHVFMGEGDWEQDISSMSKIQMFNRAYERQHIRLPDFSGHVTLYLKNKNKKIQGMSTVLSKGITALDLGRRIVVLVFC